MELVRDLFQRTSDASERDRWTVSHLVARVDMYVSELEQVVEGVESHAAVLRGMRESCHHALNEITATAQERDDAVLYRYERAARRYLNVLDSFLTGEGAGEATVSRCRAWYEQSRASIKLKQ